MDCMECKVFVLGMITGIIFAELFAEKFIVEIEIFFLKRKYELQKEE